MYYFDGFDEDEIEKLVEKLEKTKDRTEFVLKHVRQTREDDMLLWFFVNWVFNRENFVKLGKLILWLNKHHGNRKIPYDKVEVVKKVLSGIIPEDTVSRCRRKIQNDEGKYLPSKPVREDRRYKEGLWRKASRRF